MFPTSYFLICLIFFRGANGVRKSEPKEEILTSKSFFPPTVDSIELSSYLGRWYQMYASLIPNQTFEKAGYCVTADYFPLPLKDVAFGLNNSETIDSPTGDIEVASGVSFVTGDPGKYQIVIGNGKSASVGSYWIVELGEIPRGEKQYPWSIVSTPYETSLFILARDVKRFRSRYEQDVLERAKRLGFKFFYNKPLPTYQEDDCNYYTPPSSVSSCRQGCYFRPNTC